MSLEKKIDLLILDDLPEILSLISVISKDFNLSTIKFSSGICAISYIESHKKENFPLSYLVDMKICENVSNENLSSELESSEKIYHKLKSKNADLDLFRYMSGHRSGHDDGVLNRTGSDFILKDNHLHNYLIEIFFPKILEKKNSL